MENVQMENISLGLWLSAGVFFVFIGFELIMQMMGQIERTEHHPAVIWWETPKNKILVCVGLVVISQVLHFSPEHLKHALIEYVEFAVLLTSLFVIGSAIALHGDLVSYPSVITLILGIGSILNNIYGSFGAGVFMLPIIIESIRERQYHQHVVFYFIVIVGNVTAILLPTADPPLYYGVVKGVPFFWTLQHLWKAWLVANPLLLGSFYVIDSFIYYTVESRESRKLDEERAETIFLRGKRSLIFGLFVVGIIAIPWPENIAALCRTILIAVVGYASFKDKKSIEYRERNAFEWEPMIGVLLLFLLIFSLLPPVKEVLREAGPESGVDEPLEYIVLNVILSEVVDNTPTYDVATETAASIEESGHFTESFGENVGDIGVPSLILVMISIGTVWGGAGSYIGNAINEYTRRKCKSQNIKTLNFVQHMIFANILLAVLIGVVHLIYLQ